MVLLRVVAAHQRRRRQRRRIVEVGEGRSSRTFPFDIANTANLDTILLSRLDKMKY